MYYDLIWSVKSVPRDRQYELISSFLCAHTGELLLFFSIIITIYQYIQYKIVCNHEVSERIA